LADPLLAQDLLLRLEVVSCPVKQNVAKLPLDGDTAGSHGLVVRIMLQVERSIGPGDFNTR
jgi:hypothetical protein